MKLSIYPYLLEYKHAFGVSSNTRTHTQSVFIRIEWEGFFGYGEACLPPYLGETLEMTVQFLNKSKHIINEATYPFSFPDLINEIDLLDSGCNAAKAAIDIALHDLLGQIENKTVRDIYHINDCGPKTTACTIGIDTEEKIKLKIREASEFSILKIKAGTSNDKALIQTIRKYTDKPLYIDMNQGWTDKFFAVDMMHWFKEQNVILVEQPLAVNKTDDMSWITEQKILPTIADESVKRLCDLEKTAHAFDGLNIKLMKSTGLYEAVKMIEFAKQNDKKIFLGCMAESSCATSAMAQLMCTADYIDLDAPELLKNDPFKGIEYRNGMIHLNSKAGIGAELKIELEELL